MEFLKLSEGEGHFYEQKQFTFLLMIISKKQRTFRYVPTYKKPDTLRYILYLKKCTLRYGFISKIFLIVYTDTYLSTYVRS